MSNNEPSPGEFITQKAAKEQYGLTPALFALLPAPILKWQPGGRTPLKLYRRADIEAMLQTPEAQPLVERARAKKAAAAKANIRKEQKKVLVAISEIHVHKTDFDVIASRASLDNDRLGPYIRQMHVLELPEGFPPLEIHYDESTLKNALRYVLKHLADYNSTWFIEGISSDCRPYFREYRYAVLDKVAEVYPELKNVCEKRKTSFFS